MSKQLSKSHPNYWKERVFRAWHMHEGEKRFAEEYSVKIQHAKDRRTINLGTASVALRHSDIQVTRDTYLDQKEAITFGVSQKL